MVSHVYTDQATITQVEFSSGLACHFMSAGKHASLTVALHKVHGREGLVTRLSQVI